MASRPAASIAARISSRLSSTKTPILATPGAAEAARSRATPIATRRGDTAAKLNPRQEAPSSQASSTSRGLVRPQIFTSVIVKPASRLQVPQRLFRVLGAQERLADQERLVARALEPPHVGGACDAALRQPDRSPRDRRGERLH